MPSAMPLGTVRQMKRWGTLINMVKVSHHGTKWQRWRPQSMIEVEQRDGTIPLEHQVYHRDGDSLNDSPDNLIVTRSNRLQLNLQRSRSSRKRQQERRATAVRRANRIRGRVGRSVQIRLSQFYPVCHATRTIILKPFRTKHQAAAQSTGDGFCDVTLVGVRGDRLESECPGYHRMIPDEGQSWVWQRA